jgi:hypothetical protein
MTETAIAERKVDHQLADNIAVSKGGINFQNAGEIMEFSKMMAASGSAVPKHLRGQPGACLGILDDAIRFQINPYALARQSYFVNDMLAYQAAVFMAVINAHAPLKTRPDIRFDGEGQEMRATVIGIFRDGAERTYTSPRIADITPKNSPLWKSDPAQQLSYYSLRAFARRWCPEVIMGIHDVDELREAAMTDITPRAEPARAIPKSLDEFAAEPTAPAPQPEPRGDAASGPVDVQQAEPAAAGADSASEASGTGGPNQKALLLSWLIALCRNDALTEEEKLEQLELRRGAYDDWPKEFLDKAFGTAQGWITGKRQAAAAQKYLEGL